jgi:uncharacterized protein YkwD
MRASVRPLLWLASIGVFMCVAATATPAEGATRAASAVETSPLEAALIREINATRTARGLGTLARSRGLDRAAASHSLVMLATGTFEHDVPGAPTLAQRLRRYYAGRAASWQGAENLASYGPVEPTAKKVVELWLNSPPHRAILLDRSWRDLGIAARFADAPGGDFNGQPTWVITLDLGRRAG